MDADEDRYLVYLVYLVSFVQPNKRDKPNNGFLCRLGEAALGMLNDKC